MDEGFDHREVPHAKAGDAPWFFKLARALTRRNVRGSNRLMHEVRKRGLLDRFAVYSLGEVDLRVPLWRPCNAWDAADVLGYEQEMMQVLAPTIRALPGNITVVDCGADIGTVSAHLVSRCHNITEVIAFEPNAVAHRVLVENMRAMPVSTEPKHAAVGSFTGRGRLVCPKEDPSAHAMYIEPDPQGDVQVMRVDDLGLPRGGAVVIKIDVEGTERDVIEGARATIRDARAVVVVFEAHPRVIRRTREDPVVVMRALRELRPDFTFEIDKRDEAIRLDLPLFEQIPPTTVYNVIATSLGS